jgi:hypothetical protein
MAVQVKPKPIKGQLVWISMIRVPKALMIVKTVRIVRTGKSTEAVGLNPDELNIIF